MKTISLLFVCALCAFSTVTAAQESRPGLSAASAKAIVAGCEAYALDKGWTLTISVFDEGANPCAFLRMDGASLASADIAPWKARASATYRRATKAAAEGAREFPALAAAPNIAIFEGGEAIFTENGDPPGGAGASGATGAQDAECVRAGIAAAGLRHDREDG